jgi:hypothetical protein
MPAAIAIGFPEFVAAVAYAAVIAALAVFLAHFLWWLGTQLPLLGDVLQSLFNWVQDTARGIAGSLIGGISGPAAGAIHATANNFRAVLQQAALASIVIAQQVVYRYQSALAYAASQAYSALVQARDFAWYLYSLALSYADTVARTVRDYAASLYWNAIAHADSLFNQLKAYAESLYNSAISVAQQLYYQAIAYTNSVRDSILAQLAATAAALSAAIVAARDAAISASRAYTDARVYELNIALTRRLEAERSERLAAQAALSQAIAAVDAAFRAYLDRCGNPLCRAYLDIVPSLLEMEELAEAGLILSLLFEMTGRDRQKAIDFLNAVLPIGEDVWRQIPR